MSSLFIELVVFELVWEIQPLCLFRKERAAANVEINTGAVFPYIWPSMYVNMGLGVALKQTEAGECCWYVAAAGALLCVCGHVRRCRYSSP